MQQKNQTAIHNMYPATDEFILAKYEHKNSNAANIQPMVTSLGVVMKCSFQVPHSTFIGINIPPPLSTYFLLLVTFAISQFLLVQK